MKFKMLQTQQAAIAQLQNQNRAPSMIELDPSQEIANRAELVVKRSNGGESETNPTFVKMLEELTK